MFGRNKKKGEKPAKPKKEKKAKPSKKAKAKPSRKAKGKTPKTPGAPVKKRPTDIYTVMLMLSLGFVVFSCLFLGMELSNYGFPSNLTPWK